MKPRSWTKRPSWAKRPSWLSRPELRPTARIALALVILATVGLVLWFTTPGLKAWVPNITVGVITVAITIMIIHRAIRREVQQQERRHRERRIDSVVHSLGMSFLKFMSRVVTDYAMTHIDSFKEVPHDAAEMIDFWVAELGTVDADHPRDGLPFAAVVLEGKACPDVRASSRS